MPTETLLGVDRQFTSLRKNGHSPHDFTNGVHVTIADRSSQAHLIKADLLCELGELQALRGTGVDMTLKEGRITELERALGRAYTIEGKPIPAHPSLR